MSNLLLALPVLALHLIPAVGMTGTPAGQTMATRRFLGAGKVIPSVQLAGEPTLTADGSISLLVESPRPATSLISMKINRQVRTVATSTFSWTLETECGRAAVAYPLVFGRTLWHRYLSAEGTLGWDLGSDYLIGHIAAELDKRPDLVASGDRAFAKTRSLAGGIGWSHSGHWRLDLTMRQTTAQARSPVARLVDLASGAPRAERQAQAQLSLAPMMGSNCCLSGTKTLTIGAQGSAGQLTGFDQELAGSGQRDDGAGVFAPLAFSIAQQDLS